MPPITGPLVAALASLADMTRWNTSCCGIEPSIMVMAAAKKKTMSWKLGSGQNLNRSLLDRQRHDAVGTAGLLAGEHRQDEQPGHQDDHLQEVGDGHRPHAAEQRVGQDRHRADDHARRRMQMAPPDSMLNTSPSAVTCAETQPR